MNLSVLSSDQVCLWEGHCNRSPNPNRHDLHPRSEPDARKAFERSHTSRAYSTDNVVRSARQGTANVGASVPGIVTSEIRGAAGRAEGGASAEGMSIQLQSQGHGSEVFGIPAASASNSTLRNASSDEDISGSDMTPFSARRDDWGTP